MPKWKSKVTNTIYDITDAFRDSTFMIAIFKEDEGWGKSRPLAVVSPKEFLDNFEKVEE